MFTVYVIQSERNKRYIGHTANLEERLARHNGKLKRKVTSFTNKNGHNWKVVYTEAFEDRSSAIKREHELKSFQGRKFIKNLIKNSSIPSSGASIAQW